MKREIPTRSGDEEKTMNETKPKRRTLRPKTPRPPMEFHAPWQRAVLRELPDAAEAISGAVLVRLAPCDLPPKRFALIDGILGVMLTSAVRHEDGKWSWVQLDPPIRHWVVEVLRPLRVGDGGTDWFVLFMEDGEREADA